MADTKISALANAAALGGTEQIPGVQSAANVNITPNQIKTHTLTSYAGATSITTLGTVATGTWGATAIGATVGGTAQTTYATGDILYASGVNTLAKLAAGTNTHVLTLAAGVPSWAAPTGGGTPGGSDTQVQFNDSSAFGGDAGLTFNKTSNALSVTGQIISATGAYDVAAPQFTGSLSTTTGFSITGGGVFFSRAGANVAAIPSVGFAITGSKVFGFSAAAADEGDPDTAFQRSAAGVMWVTNGASAGAALQFTEQTAPSAGAVNTVRIYAEDNGSGKTRLMALFNTGAAQQIAIEP